MVLTVVKVLLLLLLLLLLLKLLLLLLLLLLLMLSLVLLLFVFVVVAAIAVGAEINLCCSRLSPITAAMIVVDGKDPCCDEMVILWHSDAEIR